jgi:DNA-binding MarR family transcriptional regulator
VSGPRFDAVVHAPNRLQICAMLAAVESAEFAAVRDELQVSDSVLSKHVKVLEDAGYVEVTKATVTSRQRTWLALTRAGRQALAGHVLELQRLLSPGGR